MNVRRTIGLCGLVAASLIALPALRAQEAPPETAGGEGGGTKLVFKFKTGQTQRFRANAKSDMTITPEGGGAPGAPAGGLGALPIGMKMQYVYLEKVTGTRQGTGTVAASIESMTLTSDVMGMSSVMRVQNGKATALVNGKPVPANQPGMADAMKQLVSQTKTTMKRDPQGGTTLVSGTTSTATAAGGMTGSPAFSGAILPDKPVSVGDTWETVQKVKPQIPGGAGAPGGAGPQIPEIELRFTHTLKSIDTKSGKQFAIIESTGSASAPDAAGGAVQGLNQNVNSTTRFDIARGAVVSGRYNADFSMKMDLTQFAGAGAPAGAPSSMSMDGTMEMTFMEAPAAAPAKKPAARRPTRRR